MINKAFWETVKEEYKPTKEDYFLCESSPTFKVTWLLSQLRINEIKILARQFLSIEKYAKYNEDFKVGSSVLFMFTGPYMWPVEQRIQIRKDFLNWVINETSDTV